MPLDDSPELACGNVVEPLILLPIGHSVVALSKRWLVIIKDLLNVVFVHVSPEYYCRILFLRLIQTGRNSPCCEKDVDSVSILKFTFYILSENCSPSNVHHVRN